MAVGYKELVPGLTLGLTGNVPDTDSGAQQQAQQQQQAWMQRGLFQAAAWPRLLPDRESCQLLLLCRLHWTCGLTAVPACAGHAASLPCTHLALSSAAKLGIDYTGVPHLLVKSSVSLTAAPKVRQGVCWRSPSGSYTSPIGQQACCWLGDSVTAPLHRCSSAAASQPCRQRCCYSMRRWTWL